MLPPHWNVLLLLSVLRTPTALEAARAFGGHHKPAPEPSLLGSEGHYGSRRPLSAVLWSWEVLSSSV